MQLNHLFEEGVLGQADYETAIATTIEFYTNEIEEYFDTVLEGIENLWRSIDRSIQDLQYTLSTGVTVGGRTAAGIGREINQIWGGLGSASGAYQEGMDIDQWLSDIADVQALVVERYELEKQAIEEQISKVQAIKSAYESLHATVTSILLDVRGGGLNQQTAQERLTYYEQAMADLRTQIAGETDLEKKAGLQEQLAQMLRDYLGIAEDVYQRPSDEYGEIYDAVIAELEGLRDDATTQIGIADQQLIALDTQLVGLFDKAQKDLAYLKQITEDAYTLTEDIRDDYLSLIHPDLGEVIKYLKGVYPNPREEELIRTTWSIEANTGLTVKKLSGIQTSIGSLLNEIRNMAPKSEQTGIDFVPYDNYRATLHKGEKIVRARENTGDVSVPINLTVNAGSGSAKELANQLKHEIRHGSLGSAIEERVRSVA
jgi:hypothetical protein